MMRGRKNLRRWVGVVTITVVSALLVACTPEGPSVPGDATDGGPLPSGATFESVPWKPEEAPRLLEQLRALQTDPAFAETLDPATRDKTLQQMGELLSAPDAEAQIRDYLTEEQAASAEWTKKGRIPPAPSRERMIASGAGADTDSVTPAGESPTFPDEEADPPPVTSVEDISPRSTPATEVKDVTVEDTGRRWPSPDAENAWPVYGGSQAELMGEWWLKFGQERPKSMTCSAATTGARKAPTTPIPAFESRIYTPTQGTYTNTVDTSAPHPSELTVASGELETRLDPTDSRILQFKVEAHLLSPVVHPILGTYFWPTDFRGHIVVEQLGKPALSYFPNSPHTEFRTLCYKDDLGSSNPARGYVEAWIPMNEPETPKGDIGEPGFQVRFESVDNFWDPNAGWYPTIFYGADQVTVLQTKSGVPLGHDDPLASGSLALRVSDGLLTDDDGNTANDLESALRAQVTPAVGNALESLQGAHQFVPVVNSWFWINDVDANGYSLDLSLKPVAPSEDEFSLNAAFELTDLFVKAMYGLGPNTCYLKMKIKGKVEVAGTVDIASNPQALKVNTTVAVSGVDFYDSVAWGINLMTGLPSLACFLPYLTQTKFARGWIEKSGTEKLQGLLDEKLAQPLDLNLDDVLAPGITLPGNANGVDFGFAGFVPSCPPLGCQGGDVLIDRYGVAALGALSAHDKKPAGISKRFPNVFDPTIGSAMADAYTSPITPGGQRYRFGAFVTPALINQLLRSLTEGGQGYPPSGMLDLSTVIGSTHLTIRPTLPPMFVNQKYAADQPPFTIFVPDLRISDGSNLLAVNVAIGFDVTVDAQTHKLTPSLQVLADFDTLKCGQSSAFVFSYALCASSSWSGGAPPALPSVPDAMTWVVNTVIPPLLQNSIGQVEIPPAVGFDLLSLGNIGAANADGVLAVYLGMNNPPASLSVMPYTPIFGQPNGQFRATALNLPGTWNAPSPGDVTFDWKVVGALHTYDPPPTTAVALPSSYFFKQNILDIPPGELHQFFPVFPPGGSQWVDVTVTASRGGVTLTHTGSYPIHE